MRLDKTAIEDADSDFKRRDDEGHSLVTRMVTETTISGNYGFEYNCGGDDD